MGPRGAATASVPLKVTGGTPSVYVPAVFDAEENSHVLKPHTTYEGAWKAAEGKCAEDKSLYRFEVWEMELVIDGTAPPAPLARCARIGGCLAETGARLDNPDPELWRCCCGRSAAELKEQAARILPPEGTVAAPAAGEGKGNA